MSLTETVITGTLTPDGVLVLDRKPDLAPGRVTIVLRRDAELEPTQDENWLECLRAIRAKREAEGYPFMHERETTAHVEWLREGDRIDDLLREAEGQGGSSEPS